MSWWWPFKKREAQRAASDFREMFDQAMLNADDLNAATAKLRESRKPNKRAEDPSPDDAPPSPNPRPRNV